jgi:formylglycine-generating enzyme required for sulfatase activity
MANWKDFLTKLADKVNKPILAFGILIVTVVALLGNRVPPVFQTLIYIVVIGVMLIDLANSILSVVTARASKPPEAGKEPEPQRPTITPEPPPELTKEPDEVGQTVSALVSGPSGESVEDPWGSYLQSVIADCRQARLAGVDPQAADPSRSAFSLDKLYISLDTSTLVPVKDEGQEYDDRLGGRQASPKERSRPLGALEMLEQPDERWMVLLGLPGSGKSTFVRYLALRHAQALANPGLDIGELLPGWQGGALMPVMISLGRYAESLPADLSRGRAEHLRRYLRTMFAADGRSGKFAEELLGDLERRGGLFLFDGLDEVADLGLRPLVVQALEEFVERYGRVSSSRFLVTCRTFSYTDPAWKLTAWPAHELAPFDPEKVTRFIDGWHAELLRVDPAKKAEYERKRQLLHEALRPGDRRRLAEIADNPLILTIMAVVHTNKGELPDARALVYEDCIEILLLRWQAQRQIQDGVSQQQSLLDALGVPRITLERALQEVAYRAHESQAASGGERSAALVTEDLLVGALRAAFRDMEKVETFLAYCESANGLLLLQGVAPLPDAPPDTPPLCVYTFPHLTFQEYLAGRYLGRLPNLGRNVRQHLDRSDRWREVVMLLGEHLCFREGDFERMDAIIAALAPDSLPQKMGETDWRALWMAGDLLTIYRRALQGKPEIDLHVRRGLVCLLEEGALSARERAAAGDTLAALGDPRFDPGLWHLLADSTLGFVHVPAGSFLMGSDKKADPVADEDELPQHEVRLPEYWIARYPTTVAQFRAFVEDSGHKPDLERSLDGVLNHPVVNVTWHDAISYRAWLDGALKRIAPEMAVGAAGDPASAFWRGLAEGELAVSLPSEAEWEKAARGTDGRIYPWGPAFDSEKANMGETGLGRTSPVGCFPGGASPYGLLDMSGNVWEWTRSLYGNYPYPSERAERLRREDLSAGSDEGRVVRGGGFNDYRYGVRCASRYGFYPRRGNYHGGFRVVLALSALGSGNSAL